MGQEVVIPASQFSPGLDADAGFLGGGLLEQVQRDVAHHRHVLRRVVLADTAFIFAEGDVEHPVQVVLDSPVAADGAGKFLTSSPGRLLMK